VEPNTGKFQLAKKEQLQSRQALELEQATQKGLLVDVSPVKKKLTFIKDGSPPSIITASSSMSLMDKWEQNAKDDDSMDDDFAAIDSDDDLL
jgi:hypothetical protein